MKEESETLRGYMMNLRSHSWSWQNQVSHLWDQGLSWVAHSLSKVCGDKGFLRNGGMKGGLYLRRESCGCPELSFPELSFPC